MFQLHVSGLNMLAKCGVQFEKRYLEGIKIAPGVSAVIGTAVDRSVSMDLANKIAEGMLLSVEQVRDIARDALVREWGRGVEANQEDAEDGISATRDDAIDASVDLAVFHHDKVAPAITPTHVQRSWVLGIQDINMQLAGTIDIQEGLKSIRDTKTSAKSPAKDLADTSLQLTTYALAVDRCDGSPPEKVALDYCVRTPKRHETKLVQLESTRTARDFPHLLERIYQAHRMLSAGLFMPAPTDAWWCSAKWCGYWRQCKYAARPASVAVNGGS